MHAYASGACCNRRWNGMSSDHAHHYLSCRKAARHQRHCAAQVVRQLARSNERRCRAALAVWADHIADKTAMRSRFCTAVHRLALLRLGTAFSSWARYAEAKRLRCMHFEGLLQRV